MTDAGLIGVARVALEQWNLNPSDLSEVSRSENIVFRVDTSMDGVFVLRMHRPGYHSYEELLSEQCWTKALGEAGIDVPVALATRKGAAYGRIRVFGEERYVGVLEWVEGQTLRSLIEADPDRTAAELRFRQLGRLLALLHNHAARWPLPSGFTRHAVDAEGLMGERPFWGPFWRSPALTVDQQKRFRALKEKIFEILRQLPKPADSFGLIHADLHPGNVVVNGERLHVIDFDDAGFGWHAYDVAVALKDYEAHADFSAYRDALVEGYRGSREFSDEMLATIPLFMLIRVLASIGWIAARPELGHPEYALHQAEYVDARAHDVLAGYHQGLA